MKTTVINKDQEGKLLKMCGKLFPEHAFNIQRLNIDFHWLPKEEVDDIKLSEYNVGDNILLFVYFKHNSEMQSTPDYIVPWFEFCYTHLLGKIFNSGKFPIHYYAEDPAFDDTNGRITFGVEYTHYNEFHPVDWLYEWFEKLES